MTDTIALFLSIYFLIRGAARGFLNSIIFPLCIIATTALSIVYYQLTKELILTLIIGIAGPFLLFFLFKLIISKALKAVNSEIKPSLLSRLGGALLTLAWGWVFISCTVLLLAVLPCWGKTMTFIHNDVTKSASYFFAKPWGESFFGPSIKNTKTDKGTASENAAKSLANDPRFQILMNDPEIQKEIDAHDMVKLMSNPKMIELTQQIISDPETMKKVMAIYSTQNQPEETNSTKNY